MQDDPDGYGAHGRRAVQMALADAALLRYDPDLEKNPVALSTRRAALKLIAYERSKFSVATPVYFGFAANLTYNAFAHRTTHDVICVNIGTMVALWNATNFLLSDPHFLPSLDGDLESRYEPSLPGAGLLIYCTSNPTRLPVSKLRAELAGLLFAACQYFIITHEITHIFAGHVDLMAKAHRHASPYQEVRADDRDPLDPMVLHSMEYEADAYAAIRGVESSTANNTFSKFDPFLDAIEDYKKNKQTGSAELFFSFMAAYLCFRLLDQQYSASHLIGKSHPLASVRQAYLYSVMPYQANQRGYSDMSGQKWVDISYHCVREVELAFGRFSHPNSPLRELLSSAYVKAMFSDNTNYFQRLSKSLNDLRNNVHGLGRGNFRDFDIPRF